MGNANQVVSGSRQVSSHQLLLRSRKKWLIDALREAASGTDPNQLKSDLSDLVPVDVQAILAGAGIRDEEVFPTPTLLAEKPTLLGYYRLLLGMSQKSFYGKEAGLGRFKSMETSGMLRQAQRECLDQLCLMLTDALSEMIRRFSPIPTTRDIQELPLLTLGAQFQGQRNVLIGQEATTDVFIAILDIVKPHIRHRSDRRVEILNASNRKVVIALSHDPDVRIQEEFGDHFRNKVAMEIKGGTDFSNIHNRAGEAEKSHQKAKLEGYRDYWTIIMMKSVSLTRLHEESPTTNSWFDAAQVLGQQGPDWNEFRSRVADAVGIPEE